MAEVNLSWNGRITPALLNDFRRIFRISALTAVSMLGIVGGTTLITGNGLPIAIGLGVLSATFGFLLSVATLQFLLLLSHELSDDADGGHDTQPELDRRSATEAATVADEYPTVGKYFLTTITDVTIRGRERVYIDADVPYDTAGEWSAPFPHGWNPDENFVAGLAENRGYGPTSLDQLIGDAVLVQRNDNDDGWTMLENEPTRYIKRGLADEALSQDDIQTNLVSEELDIVFKDEDITGIVVEDLPDDVLPDEDYR